MIKATLIFALLVLSVSPISDIASEVKKLEHDNDMKTDRNKIDYKLSPITDCMASLIKKVKIPILGTHYSHDNHYIRSGFHNLQKKLNI